MFPGMTLRTLFFVQMKVPPQRKQSRNNQPSHRIMLGAHEYCRLSSFSNTGQHFSKPAVLLSGTSYAH